MVHPEKNTRIFWHILIQILIPRIRNQKGLQAGTLKLWHASKFPGARVRTQISGSRPGNSDSVGLEWSLKMCISSRFPKSEDSPCAALEIIFLTTQHLLSSNVTSVRYFIETIVFYPWLSVLCLQRYSKKIQRKHKGLYHRVDFRAKNISKD